MPDGSAPVASTSKQFWSEAQNQAAVELPIVARDLERVRAPPLRVSRVAQLDSELLDRELSAILQDPVNKALQDFNPNFEPELSALLRFVVLRLALYEGGASYGAKLQNLKYRDERRYEGAQKSSPVVFPPTTAQFNVYSLLTVLPTYLHGRFRDSMLSHGWADYPVPRPTLQLLLPRLFGKANDDLERDAARRRRELRRWTWDLLSSAEKIWQIASLANFLVFLYDGRYRTLFDRVLRMRLTYAQRTVTRNVSFEFLNRQLVWEAFTEFLLFLMPLINLRKLRLRVARLLAKSTAAQLALASVPVTLRRALRLPDPIGAKATSGKGAGDKSVGPLHHLGRNTCAICYSTSQAPPTSVPHTVDPADPSSSTSGLASLTQGSSIDTDVKVPYMVDCCRSLYCYFCVVGRMVAWEEEHAGLAETGWPCLRCGKGVQNVERYMGEAVDDPAETHAPDEAADESSE